MATEITLNDYKLSCELLGHSLDVRAVAEGKDSIISGSRDKTVKVWKKEGNEYREEITYSDHTNFVSTVLYLEDENWICTGSNDSTICIYKIGTLIPFVVLKGHTSTVCTLAKGLKSGTLVSGSWDKTGRIWTIDDSGTSTFITLKGHEAAVWAVATLPTRKYVTGSADKTIAYWNEKGEKLRILKGHQDCVRGLIGMEDGSLISCSNDAVIKYWNEEGECVRELFGHSNFVYSIALNRELGQDVFVSGSEDSTIRMWSLKAGNLGDAITLPAQSVWSVTCLKNGDIVTGTSDGIVRVFTRNPSRIADKEKIKSFHLAVETRKLEANQELGGIKRNDLPGPESLLEPGKEGQTKLVRQPDGKILCYQWEKNQWSLIGDVMGASGGNQANSGKTLYEGKEYDYVFSVDISDDSPPLKLPYNRGEDPWLSAQSFIHKNNLPQVYLDQVANFIIKNSDTPVIHSTNSGFEDPFTGGSRYIPVSNMNNANIGGNVDPFTGSSSYSTVDKPKLNQVKHFPFNKYLTFDKCDPSKILDKLKEFNKTASSNGAGINEDLLTSVIKLTDMESDVDRSSIEALQQLLNWPKEILFPVLDIARLTVRNELISAYLLDIGFLDNIIENLASSPANQLMSIRSLVNMMSHKSGRNYIKSKFELIIKNVIKIKQGSSNLQIALSTLYLNFTITQTELANSDECKLIAEGIIEFLKWCTDLEAYYRCIQGLGNLICTPYGNVISAQIISTDFVIDKIREFSSTQQTSGYEKITECSKELLAAF